MRETGIFPYANDYQLAANSDATIVSVPTGREPIMPYPTRDNVDQANSNRGKMIDGGLSETDYVYCTEVAYGVFAGDA